MAADITPHCRVFLENVTVPQLVTKFPAFYGTQKLITVFATASILSHMNRAHGLPHPLLTDILILLHP
jgi:hypothetical protein